MSVRSDKRRAKYNELRSLGLTPKEARTFRDRSSSRINSKLTEQRAKIESKPAKKRSPAEHQQLEKLEKRQKSGGRSPPTPEKLRNDRRADFSRWSGKQGFPDSILNKIAAINKAAGLPAKHSYGFRVFFHQYVDDIEDEEEIDELIEAGSG